MSSKLILRAGAGLALAFVFCGSGFAAAPQLDLPKKRRVAPPSGGKQAPPAETGEGRPGDGAAGEGAKSGDIAGDKVETKSETSPLVRSDGKPVGTTTTTKVNAPASAKGIGVQDPKSEGKRRSLPSLDLPSRRRTAPAEGAGLGEPSTGGGGAAPSTEGGDAPLGGEPLGSDPLAVLPTSRGSARVLYAQLDKRRPLSDPAVVEISDRLARLGQDGLEVSRYALLQPDPAVAYAGARTLLVAGDGGDGDLVVRLLRGDVPRKAAAAILEELVERDPVRATNDLLTALMRHDVSALRRAAAKHLRPRVRPDDVPALARVMNERSPGARRLALEVLATVDDPAAVDVLLDAVTDNSTSVAAVAIEEISRSDDDRIDFELLRRTFASGTIGRDEAHLLLAIIDREDRATEPLLTRQHVPALLDTLESPVTLASNVAAVALAGIGFRSPAVEETTWLNGIVPSKLTGIAAGVEFFEAFELVRTPAIRRLRHISGLTHGNDGPAWADWWVEEGPGFRASRAMIEVEPGDERKIIVTAHDPEYGPPMSLVGSALASDPAYEPPPGSTVYYMLDADARELVDLMTEEGLFGFERLPGPRGAIGAGGQVLEIELDGRRKAFRFGAGLLQPWFARVMSRVFGLEDRLSWQDYTVAGVHESPRDLFLEEQPWWSGNPSQEARVDRIEKLAYRHLKSLDPSQRGETIRDLARMDEEHDSADADDVSELLDLLSDETGFGDNARLLTDLIASAIGVGADKATALTDSERATVAALIDTLHDTFGSIATTEIEDLLRGLGRDATLAAASDDRSLLRIASAGVLGAEEELPWPGRDEALMAEEEEMLVTLSLDEDRDVQVAAIRGLAGRPSERAEELIIARAKAGPIALRAAALEALGALDPPGAIDLLVLGLTDSNERLHLPATRGLARLERPTAAPLLLSLLRSSSPAAIRAEARDGLEALGQAARSDLVGSLGTPDEELRREVALLLAKLHDARAFPVLARAASLDPDDDRALDELAVLSCVDYRDDPLPAERYLQFWSESTQRNAFVWFTAALSRRGLKGPPASDYATPPGSEEARTFLLALLNQGDAEVDVVVERARRELERLLGEPLGSLPSRGRARTVWLERAYELAQLADGAASESR